MSDQQFERAVNDWFEDGSDRTPRRAIDGVLLAVKTTPQERDLRIPWRFSLMPALSRASGIAAVALVAAVATGGLLYLNSKGPATPGTGTTPPTATQAPTAAPTLPPGIAGWTTYRSAVHNFTMAYPSDWSVHAPATRKWHAGDKFPADDLSYVDTLANPEPGDAQIGLFVWEVPAAAGVDVESVEGLKAWATTFCADAAPTAKIASSCDDFATNAKQMCLNAGGDTCRAAILVPTADGQYAFFVNFAGALLSDYRVRVVVVARPDDFPVAARYGGSEALLKSILTTMDVWTPGEQPRS